MRTIKNIAVIGGASFIGSHFVKLSEKQGFTDITVIDALTYAGDLSRIEDCECKFSQIDITDSEHLSRYFESRTFDAFINFAAESHVDNSIKDPLIFVKTNVLGTVNLLEEGRKQFNKNSNFIFYQISTDEVFGSIELDDYRDFDENSPYDPRSPYSASKAAADHFVRAYYHTYKLPILISSCSNNYGTFQHEEKFIPTIINSLIERKTIPIYGEGKNIRDWLHVYDHCTAILNILCNGKEGETYTIGGGGEHKIQYTNLELVKEICKIYDEISGEADSMNLISFIEDRKGHDMKYWVDSTKIQNELGWSAQIKLEDGLREVIQWQIERKNAQIEI